MWNSRRMEALEVWIVFLKEQHSYENRKQKSMSLFAYLRKLTQ
jgi:hypothetical protein